MQFYPEERVALFIDGANLYATARTLGFDIDYKRLYNLFAGECRLVRAFTIRRLWRIKNTRRSGL